LKPETLDNALQNPKQKGTKSKRKFYVFLLCLIISTFIWCLIKFAKDYSTTIEFPVVFINLPKDHVLMNDVDTSLALTIRAQGFHLLKYKLFKSAKPLIIDLSKLKLMKQNRGHRAYIVTSTLVQRLSNQLDFKNTVIDISPDTLFFVFDNMVHKKVPVKLNLSLNFEKQYLLYDSIRYFPDSVIVSGSPQILDTLRYITTSKKEFEKLNESQSFYLGFFKSKNLKYTVQPEMVKVNFEVEKFTDGTIEIPVNMGNSGANLKLFPDKVNVTYLVAMKDYKSITPDMFTATVNVVKLQEHKDNKLKVEISKYPSYLRITRVDPEKVEYIIVK